MTSIARRWPATAAALALALLAAGCSLSPSRKAPVEDRMPATRAPGAAVPAAASGLPAGAAADPARPPLPGSENAGKPGYYSVRPGDTLIRIGLENGQNWRDVARWNGIDNPNLIEVGQVLRVAPPETGAVVRPVAPAGRVESRPLEARPAGAATSAAAAPAAVPPAGPASGAAQGAAASSATPASAPAATPVAAATAAAASAPASAARESDEDIRWAWPAAGPVATVFDEVRSKGVAITGRAGDPVLAAADGRVVYAGSGLRGYGNLVIVKHNAAYLTAYAHNQILLVKEDQVVRRGQKIAEMGASDAERVQLHFEVRRQGKPIDPLRVLPAR